MKRTASLLFLLSLLFSTNLSALTPDSSPLPDLFQAFSDDPFGLKCAHFLAEHIPAPEQAVISTGEIIENIRYAVKARNLMAWGRSIPEVIFMNYVLPHRISQEPFVNWRPYFFAQLAPEVMEDKNIKSAAIRVLRWFYKRLYYRPSDPRDIDPLSLLMRGWGRCEEINIAVIAGLRSVGIPARHVWVPAWGDVDGNHSWIEVYLDDGRWHHIDPSSCSLQFDSAWFSNHIRFAPVIMTYSLDDPTCNAYRKTAHDKICMITEDYNPTVDISVIPVNGEKTLQKKKVMVSLNVLNGGLLRPVLIYETLPGRPVTFSVSPGNYVIGAAVPPLPPAYRCINVNSSTRVIMNLDGHKTESSELLSCTFPSGRASSGSQTAGICPEKGRFEKLKALISKWTGESENSELVIATASIGPHAFELLSAMENLQNDRKGLFRKLLLNAPPKELVNVNPQVLTDYVKHVKAIAGSNIPESIFGPFLLNPRIHNEPVDWNLPRISGLLGRNPANLLQRAAEIRELLSRIRVQECGILPPVLTPWQILSSGVACSEKDRKLVTAALFRAGGYPAAFIDYATAVAVYDRGIWYSFNPEETEKPVSPLNPVNLSVRFSGDEEACSKATSMKYGRDFRLARWTGRTFMPVRGGGPIRNKRSCYNTFTLFPGTYDLYLVQNTDSGRRITVYRFHLEESRTIQLELP